MMMIMIITSQNFGTIQNGANKFKSTKKKSMKILKWKGKFIQIIEAKLEKVSQFPPLGVMLGWSKTSCCGQGGPPMHTTESL